MDIIDEYAPEMTILHQKAMDYAQEGFFLTRKKDHEGALRKYFSAYFLEKQVADTIIASKKDISEIEPSRSTICISCATLAKDAGQYNEAKKYADKVIEFNADSYFADIAKDILYFINRKQA